MGSSKIPPPREGLIAEIKLLAGVKKGKDLNAFQNRHVAPLWRVARLLCADDATATEVLMAALSQALAASGTWSTELPLGAWLWRRFVSYWLLREKRAGRIVEAPARGRQRGRRGGRPREKPRSSGATPDLSFDLEGRLLAAPGAPWRRRDEGESSETAATTSDPTETTATEADASRATALRLASTRLPPHLRVAWVLCDVCGEEPAATGEVLDVSTGLVLSRLHRARVLLLGLIDEEPSTVTGGRDDMPAGPTCQEVVGMLWLEPEDAVPGDLQDAFRAHLDSCGTCTELRASYRALLGGAATLRPDSVPDDLTDGVRAVVDQMHREAAAAEEKAEAAAESGETSDRSRSPRSRRNAGRKEAATADGSEARGSDTEPAPEAASEETAGSEPAPAPAAAGENASGNAQGNADGQPGESRSEGARRGSRRRRGRRNRSRNRPRQS